MLKVQRLVKVLKYIENKFLLVRKMSEMIFLLYAVLPQFQNTSPYSDRPQTLPVLIAG